MSTLTFDTLRVSRNLIEAGIPEKHAEAVTTAIKEAQDSHIEELATKIDVARIEGRLNLLQWMLAVTLAGVMALLLKSFFGIG